MSGAKRPVSIDGIEFDALIEQTDILEADVPSYPVESGFEVSDAIIIKPLTLEMKLFLTNTPVTWSRNGSPSRVGDVIGRLEDLYFEKKPVTVVTHERTYHNMAIAKIELTKTKETGTSREIPISFREVRVVEKTTTTIPAHYGRGGATGTVAGTANTTTRPVEGGRGSILHGIAQGAGLFGR